MPRFTDTAINWVQQSPPWLTQITTPGGGVIWGINANEQTADNVYVRQGGSWTLVEGLNLQSITAGPGGAVIGLGVPNGATVPWYQLEGGEWTCFSANPYTSVTLGPDGSLWTTNTNVDQSLPNIFASPGFGVALAPFSSGWLTTIAIAPNGDKWGLYLASYDQYAYDIYSWDVASSSWTCINTGTLTQMAIDNAGTLWGVNTRQTMAGFNNVSSYSQQTWTTYPVAFSCVSCDPDGNVWGVGRDGNGSQPNLYQLVDGAFQLVTPTPTQLAVSPDGGLWGVNPNATSADNIYRFQQGIWWNIPGYLTALSIAPDGSVWGVNANQPAGQATLYAWDGGANWTAVALLPPTVVATALAAAPDGSVWCVAGNQTGGSNIYQYAQGSWTAITGYLTAIAADADSVIWGVNSQITAGECNLFYYGGTWQPALEGGTYPSFTTLAVGAENNVWCLDTTGQVWRFALNQLTQPTGSLLLNSLAVNASGNFWGLDQTGVLWQGTEFSLNYDLVLDGTNYVQLGFTPFSLEDQDQDLTVEAWVSTAQAGPVFSLTCQLPNQNELAALILLIQEDGSLRGYMANYVQQDSQQSPVTTIFDGEWHHVALTRRGTALNLYFDGIEQVVKGFSPEEAVALSFLNAAYIGYYPADAVPSAATNFNGSMDEVRIWARALSEDEISYGMHHRLSGNEPALIGWYTFDEQQAMDYSPSGNTGTLIASPTFAESEIDLAPKGEPYLVTQAMLTQDYLPGSVIPGKGPNDCSFDEQDGYRVIITARTDMGAPLVCDLTLMADTMTPFTIYFADGTNALLGSGHTMTRRTTAMGELSFMVPTSSEESTSSPLTCNPLKIHADFMAPGERVIIYPDRHVHSTLATMTGNGLQGQDEAGNPLPGRTSCLPAATTASQASALAGALNHIMSTAVEHSVQPERPLTRSTDLPEDVPVPQPYVPRYQNQQGFATAYNPVTNEGAAHFLPQDKAATRILVPEQMPNAQWAYEASGVFTPYETAPAAQQALLTLLQGATVTHSNNLTQLFQGQTSVTVSASQLLTVEQSQLVTRSWLNDMWAEVEEVTAVVVNTVSATVTGVENAINTVVATIVHVVDNVVQAFDVALQTVEDAIQFVSTLLVKIGAEIQAVVDLIKALFEWNDIIVSQQAIQAGLQNGVQMMIARISDIKGALDGQLDSFKTTVDNQFASWKEKLGANTLAPAAQQKGGANQGVQGKYVTTMTTHSLSNTSASEGFSFGSELKSLANNLITSLLNDLSTQLSSLPASIQQSGTLALLSDSSTFLQGAAVALLEGIQALFDLSISLFKDVTDAVFEAAASILSALDTLLKNRIDIPLVTSFYEQVIMGGNGDELTGYSLLALLGAVPFTIAFKLASGGKAPFTGSDVSLLQSSTWEDCGWYTWPTPAQSARDGNPIPQVILDYLGAAFSFVNAGATIVWGTIAVIRDVPEVDEVEQEFGSWWQTILITQLAAQFISIATSYPLPSTPDVNNVNPLTYYLWGYSFVPFVSNIASSFGIKINGVTWGDGDTITGGFFGAISALVGTVLFIELLAEEGSSVSGWVIFANGQFSAMESWPQFIKFAEDPKIKALVPSLDILAYGLDAVTLVLEGIASVEEVIADVANPPTG